MKRENYRTSNTCKSRNTNQKWAVHNKTNKIRLQKKSWEWLQERTVAKKQLKMTSHKICITLGSQEANSSLNLLLNPRLSQSRCLHPARPKSHSKELQETLKKHNLLPEEQPESQSQVADCKQLKKTLVWMWLQSSHPQATQRKKESPAPLLNWLSRVFLCPMTHWFRHPRVQHPQARLETTLPRPQELVAN